MTMFDGFAKMEAPDVTITGLNPDNRQALIGNAQRIHVFVACLLYVKWSLVSRQKEKAAAGWKEIVQYCGDRKIAISEPLAYVKHLSDMIVGFETAQEKCDTLLEAQSVFMVMVGNRMIQNTKFHEYDKLLLRDAIAKMKQN